MQQLGARLIEQRLGQTGVQSVWVVWREDGSSQILLPLLTFPEIRH
jgi:hypothetical protein